MSTRHLIPLTLLGLSLSLSACKEEEDTGTPEGDTDSDTDADTDTDTDADADSDTDADMNLSAQADDAARSVYTGDWVLDLDGSAHLSYGDDGLTLDGELTYLTDRAGTTECDATISLTGTEYAGDCADCDWAFDITSELTRDDGTSDCYLFPQLTYYSESGFYYNFVMGYWNSYSGYYGDISQVLQTGYGVDYGAYGYHGYVYPGPYWWTVAYDGSPYGTFTQNGQLDFAWTFDYTSPQYETAYYEYCGTYVYNYATASYDGQSGQGEIDCTLGVVDVWTFDANAGDNLTITVDTVADATTFDPAFWINDPSGCTVTGADDTFTCTFPPPEYSCPSAVIRGAEAGTYEVVIYNWDCVGDTGAYEIRVGLE
ncbi:MAG: hypothetical protein ABIO70_23805 [Pseudomonadota bacterium]